MPYNKKYYTSRGPRYSNFKYRSSGYRRRSRQYGRTYKGGKRRYSTSVYRKSLKKMDADLKQLKKVNHYGDSDKVHCLSNVSHLVYNSGVLSSCCYLDLPPGMLLRAALLRRGKREAYITGISVEFDIIHQKAVDVFFCCVMGIPMDKEVEFSDDLTYFTGRSSDMKGGTLYTQGHSRALALGGTVFESLSRDGSFFGAPMKKEVEHVVPRLDVGVN
ncbi:hypothetical protein GGR57DRAFT_470487, partial [Xylariaceae sp. FL1272]